MGSWHNSFVWPTIVSHSILLGHPRMSHLMTCAQFKYQQPGGPLSWNIARCSFSLTCITVYQAEKKIGFLQFHFILTCLFCCNPSQFIPSWKYNTWPLCLWFWLGFQSYPLSNMVIGLNRNKSKYVIWFLKYEEAWSCPSIVTDWSWSYVFCFVWFWAC